MMKLKGTLQRQEEAVDVSRRLFVKGTAVAGILSAAGGAVLSPHTLEAQVQTQPQTTVAGPTLPPPPKLGAKAVPDQRFAMKWKDSVPAAMQVMVRYFKALNARNLKGMAEQLHFPLASFEQTSVVVVKDVGELLAKAPASMNMSENPERWTDHDSYLKAGSYDVFRGIEILASDPYAVNLAMVYDRYGNDGKQLLQCQGIYCVTCNEGVWGIELMSTIFTPAMLIGKRYTGTEEAALRTRIIHDIGPNTNDSDADEYDAQYGTQASVMGSDGFIPLQQNASAGNPMKTYRTIGIKSRLRISDSKPGAGGDANLNIRQSGGNPNNPADFAKYKDDWHWYREMYDVLGLGRWGFTLGIIPDSRVIHAGIDKAHLYSGLTRYNTVGEEINTSSEMSVVTWRKGRWGRAGGGAYITMHDRANDVKSLRG
jgi:hypothetical protein